MRGKRHDGISDRVTNRLIPACAGKTAAGRRISQDAWAHPRVCGENLSGTFYQDFDKGSSPRVRGKHRDGDLCRYCGGLIPACAGKTLRLSGSDETYWAHPRVCGENISSNCSGLRLSGSSPRVRGKPCNIMLNRYMPGLIPACAGKT